MCCSEITRYECGVVKAHVYEGTIVKSQVCESAVVKAHFSKVLEQKHMF